MTTKRVPAGVSHFPMTAVAAMAGVTASTGEYEISSAGERDPAIRAALDKAMEAERRFAEGERARTRARAALKEMEAQEARRSSRRSQEKLRAWVMG